MSTSHALYRFFGHDDALLYVGITLNPSRRWADHATDKAWWMDAGRIVPTHYPDRDTALAAERAAIIAEHPRFNVIHNRGVRPAPAALGPTVEPILKVRQVVALGLDEGRCPVGAVIASNGNGATLALFHWGTGYFSAGTKRVRYGDIRSMRFAVPMSPVARALWAERCGDAPGDTVWDMDPLADFQTAWKLPDA